MKRIGYLFEKAFSRENLYSAYLDAAKGKHKKDACYRFEQRLANNLDLLYDEIQSGTYQPQEHFAFEIKHPKPRKIFAPAFRDLVVQHAIYRVIYEIFDRTFIHTSYACRVGKGTHKAADYAQCAIGKIPNNSYILKMDIRKFFYRIDRIILRGLIERKIKDTKFVNMIMLFVAGSDAVGIPIGNLLSQFLALIYLNMLDQFIKRELKARIYCRYVDDFIIFGISKSQADIFRTEIEMYIKDKLNLEFSKYSISIKRRGINFVGYRTWVSKRFIRKYSLYKFKKSLTKCRLQSIISLLGHSRKTASYKYMINLIKEYHNGIYLLLPKVYRQYQYC